LGGELRHYGIIRRLIEIKTGLLRVQKIDIELQTAEFNGDRSRRRVPFQNSGSKFETFRLSDSRIIALDDRDRSKKIDNRRDDERFPQIHRQGQGLQNEIVAVAVEDYPGQTVALAPNHAAQFRID